MVEIEVRNLARQILGLDQAGVRVLGGVAGDGACLLDRRADRLPPEVGGAGRAFALAEIDGHRETPVALVLDGVHLAQPDGGAQSLAHAGVDLVLRGALAAGVLQREGDHVLEQWGRIRRLDRLWHTRSARLGEMGQNLILAAARPEPFDHPVTPTPPKTLPEDDERPTGRARASASAPLTRRRTSARR